MICITTYLPWSHSVRVWTGARSPSGSIGGKVLCSIKKGKHADSDTRSCCLRTFESLKQAGHVRTKHPNQYFKEGMRLIKISTRKYKYFHLL